MLNNIMKIMMLIGMMCAEFITTVAMLMFGFRPNNVFWTTSMFIFLAAITVVYIIITIAFFRNHTNKKEGRA